jgi:hypothetical protein
MMPLSKWDIHGEDEPVRTAKDGSGHRASQFPAE